MLNNHTNEIYGLRYSGQVYQLRFEVHSVVQAVSLGPESNPVEPVSITGTTILVAKRFLETAKSYMSQFNMM